MNDTLRGKQANIIVGSIIALIVGAACALLVATAIAPQGYQAIVHDSDGEEHVLDLGSDSSLSIQTDLGYNVIVVENGAVSVSDADCPNGDCLRQRAISKPGEQLICLPHRLWVEIVVEGEPATSMDIDAAHPLDGVDIVAR